MNTTPTLISPARTVDTKAGATRESGAAEMPFSQVLSDEMSSQRNAQAGRSPADTSGAAEAAARSEPAPEATPAETTETATTAESPSADTVDPALQANAPDPAALLGLAAVPVAAAAAPPAQIRTDTAALTPGVSPVADDANALAQALDSAARQGRAPQAQAGAQAGVGAAAVRAEAAPSGSAAQQSVAAAPAIQPAAAQQADAAGAAGESGFEQMLHAALRAPEPLQQAAARLSAEAAQPRLAPAVGSNAWGQALGDRIVWMANAAQQSATLTLNPPNLGPLQVVLNVSNDQAVANFYAAQPEVRQALESAFPRLKEMLNEAGIQLEQATVSADTSPQQQDTAAGRSSGHAAGMRSEAATLAAELPAALPAQRTGRGLIDTFA